MHEKTVECPVASINAPPMPLSFVTTVKRIANPTLMTSLLHTISYKNTAFASINGCHHRHVFRGIPNGIAHDQPVAISKRHTGRRALATSGQSIILLQNTKNAWRRHVKWRNGFGMLPFRVVKARTWCWLLRVARPYGKPAQI